MTDEQFPIGFAVVLMWQEKSGTVRRVTGRCLDLSQEAMEIETMDRVIAGTMVLVTSDEFGRMGYLSVRYCQRDRMRCVVGLKFCLPFKPGKPDHTARRKTANRVMNAQSPDTSADSPAR